jgi:hypothetical protein
VLPVGHLRLARARALQLGLDLSAGHRPILGGAYIKPVAKVP